MFALLALVARSLAIDDQAIPFYVEVFKTLHTYHKRGLDLVLNVERNAGKGLRHGCMV